jgi:uncharacterized protein YigE (DUF2233 family)
MRRRNQILTQVIFLLLSSEVTFGQPAKPTDSRFITYTASPKTQTLKLYWKDDKQQIFRSIGNLKSWLERKHSKLVFAMNAGMYMEDYSPVGLFVDNGKVVRGLNTRHGGGNFYMEPNGVFYITTDNVAGICSTGDYKNKTRIKYATQSGPMMVVDGQINTGFKEGSFNLNIRNGVGILPDGRAVFVMSKREINFYDFAEYFRNLGCKNALFLDGFVCRTYLPEQRWMQTDGDFGVMVEVEAEGK